MNPAPGNDPVGKAALENLRRSLDEVKARGWAYGAYNEALELIVAMEDRLSTSRKVPLKRFVLVPVALWLRGLKEMALAYGRGYSVAIGLGLSGLLLSRALPQSWQPTGEMVTLAINLFLVFTLVFAAPSTYCSAGTNSKHVTTAKDKLSGWQVSSAARVELILRNVRIFEERVKRRLLIFRWLLGAGWALYFSPALTEAAKSWASSGVSLAQLVDLFPPLGWLALAFVFVEAYARGADILFRSVEIGCHERLADIDRDAVATTQSSGVVNPSAAPNPPPRETRAL